MMAIDQSVPCPSCNGTININIRELINGGKFTCLSCGAVIAIATESKAPVRESMEKFQDFKDLRKK